MKMSNRPAKYEVLIIIKQYLRSILDISAPPRCGKSLFNFLSSSSPKAILSRIRLVGILWRNEDQHCVGGGEGEGKVERKTM